MWKSTQDLLIKSTSNGKTQYRDQYGWFSVAKSKKQNFKSPTKQNQNKNVFLTPQPNSKNLSDKGENSLASKQKWVSKSTLQNSTSYAKTQVNKNSPVRKIS